jgi:hypothetical protein
MVISAIVMTLVTLAFAEGPNPSATGPAGGGPVLLQSGFEEGLAGWVQEGQAEFAADKDQHHGGAQSARITIAPATKTQYQQLQHEVTGLTPRDRVTATVWVRTRGVNDGDGAYLVLEFLGAGGGRVDIAHSSVSRNSGKDGWDKLTVEAAVPQNAASTRLVLVLNSHGTAWFDDAEVTAEKVVDWPDLGDAQRTVLIRTGQVVQPKFGGVGFDVFDHVHDASRQVRDEVLDKRWRELNPSFARIYQDCNWTPKMLDTVAVRLSRMQETGTEIYVTTWNPKYTKTADELAAYTRKIVDSLEYLRTKGLTNIKDYCMTNELCLISEDQFRQGTGTYAALKNDLPRFKAYHQALFDELKARKLDIRLLATDAQTISLWTTIDWATRNMDEITGIYGGHHYIGEYAPDDERFYPWFLSKMQWGAGLAKSRNKDFILGEFGCKQVAPGTKVGSKALDSCAYFGTPQEPLMAIQLAEAAIAAINGGIYAMAYWTFADFPDSFSETGGVPSGNTYANKWGVFKWSGSDNATRDHYYAYGLLTKFFRGPATVYKVDANDPRLRVAAIQHHGDKTWSIAIVNRNRHAVPVSIAVEGAAAPTAALRKYVYDPNRVPSNPFGDLQDPSGKVAMKDGRLTDTVGPLALTVYTTAGDDDPPAPVQGLKESRADGKRDLSWQANSEKDLCYYRVFRSEQADFVPDVKTQIGSTIATQFTDAKAAPGKEYHYKILAVDTSGNASVSLQRSSNPSP